MVKNDRNNVELLIADYESKFWLETSECATRTKFLLVGASEGRAPSNLCNRRVRRAELIDKSKKTYCFRVIKFNDAKNDVIGKISSIFIIYTCAVFRQGRSQLKILDIMIIPFLFFLRRFSSV